jgi:hypothetical protein
MDPHMIPSSHINENIGELLNDRLSDNDQFLKSFKDNISFDQNDLQYGDWDDDPSASTKVYSDIVIFYPVSKDDLDEANITEDELFLSAFQCLQRNNQDEE